MAQVAKKVKRAIKGAKKSGKNTPDAGREARLNKVYRDFIDGHSGACDVAFAGEDPRDLGKVVLYCFSHDYVWSDHAAAMSLPCPKSREALPAK